MNELDFGFGASIDDEDGSQRCWLGTRCFSQTRRLPSRGSFPLASEVLLKEEASGGNVLVVQTAMYEL